MKSIGISKIGLVRQRNEDRFFIDKSLSIVTDGMGGYKGGEIASTMVVDSLAKQFKQCKHPSVELIRSYMNKANEEVYNRVKETPALEGMGTTAVVAYVYANTLYWANVGDSRLYIFKDQSLRQISTDHSMVQALYDAGELEKQEMINHPQRNILTRAIGVEPFVEVDGGKLEVAPGDRIMLCSDGLTGYVSPEVIEAAFKHEPSDERLVEDLIQLVYDQGAKDNVTIVVGTVE
ncbi:MAG: Stp1/IreP family PP2C-type Ser/Thr phosphatase [Veillonella sp.]|uniref:Stp1/IreP family PP2C-type Ser/Thr phosphatase n=1 Tax=Veillonella sp. TaxID=1926307 RepID=UPI0026015020|nr:Stp1/IreP family PP2C-type Ser/Thr phosphatase [Veillonella sp.]MBS4912711.1 Stp1/IreP family PP2C-type Ser/Thr phosphatase [Veillonella sp.]